MLTKKIATVLAASIGALPAAALVTQMPAEAGQRTSSVPCNWFAANGITSSGVPYSNSYSSSGIGPDLCTRVGTSLKYRRSDGLVVQTSWVFDSVGSVYYAEARGSGSVVESYHQALDGSANSGIVTVAK